MAKKQTTAYISPTMEDNLRKVVAMRKDLQLRSLSGVVTYALNEWLANQETKTNTKKKSLNTETISVETGSNPAYILFSTSSCQKHLPLFTSEIELEATP